MREIKFRAWDKNKSAMIRNSVDAEDWGPYDEWWGPEEKIAFEGLEYLAEAEHLILMQFTGLKDKNGKEIYEGDILAVDNEWAEPEGSVHWVKHIEHYEVAWGEWDGGDHETDTWILRNPNFTEDHHELYPGDLCGHSEDSEVIGNIYENPELLKPVKK
jgi:uncharacterized phage protein (TIGR01671 family)